MGRVIVDASTQAKLSAAQHTLELCDSAGHLLGHFVPVIDQSLYENIEPEISEEELLRREQKGGGRPLAAILADLDQRA